MTTRSSVFGLSVGEWDTATPMHLRVDDVESALSRVRPFSLLSYTFDYFYFYQYNAQIHRYMLRTATAVALSVNILMIMFLRNCFISCAAMARASSFVFVISF